MGHWLATPTESSTWRYWQQFSHKVIHRNGEQWEKSFHIKDLPSFFEVETGIRAQVGLLPSRLRLALRP
jgi:hypothetical protein